MWGFGTKRLRERVEELETAVRLLKSERKALETEWESVYEKYRVAMSKLARRDMKEAAQAAPETTNDHDVIPKAANDAALLRSVFPRR